MDTQPTIFLLWETLFEETPATIFVTELRSAGLRVKVVGLNSKPTAGAHGLALAPDLTLDAAMPLANQARYIIIPYGGGGPHRLRYDPRVRAFLEQALAQGAQLITNSAGVVALAALHLPSFAAEAVIVFPVNENLFEFVHSLVSVL